MSAKKKAYVVGFLVLACILLWAFLSAGFMTNGFSRSQIKKGDERQEVDVESMILTETKNRMPKPVLIRWNLMRSD